MIISSLKQFFSWLKEAVTWLESLTLGAKLTVAVLTIIAGSLIGSHQFSSLYREQRDEAKKDLKDERLIFASQKAVMESNFQNTLRETEIELENCEIEKNDMVKRKMADLEKQLEQLKTNDKLLRR